MRVVLRRADFRVDWRARNSRLDVDCDGGGSIIVSVQVSIGKCVACGEGIGVNGMVMVNGDVVEVVKLS